MSRETFPVCRNAFLMSRFVICQPSHADDKIRIRTAEYITQSILPRGEFCPPSRAGKCGILVSATSIQVFSPYRSCDFIIRWNFVVRGGWEQLVSCAWIRNPLCVTRWLWCSWGSYVIGSLWRASSKTGPSLLTEQRDGLFRQMGLLALIPWRTINTSNSTCWETQYPHLHTDATSDRFRYLTHRGLV